ncbi:MAG: TAT-variant-translocated molybdopterin oxidoreductase [Bryobacteraceae bacterium]
MPNEEIRKLDLAAIREKLESAKGPRYWQSLDELAQTDEFKELLHREFPRQASEWVDDEPGRRKFMKLMGASLALGGLTACTRQPEEKIMPYVRQPEEVIPGRPLFFATAASLSGVASGVLVESHSGRPTKIEGNPEHPASLGAADALTQASVLTLYDPDRLNTVLHYGEVSTWADSSQELTKIVAAARLNKGAGLRILSETVTSPTLGSVLKKFQQDFPDAKWHQWEPAGAHSSRAGALLAFGAPVNTFYKVENADVILTLDSDFLTAGPGNVRYAREFALRRRVYEGKKLNRLYSVESAPTNTGTKADHRWPMRSAEIQNFAAALAKDLGADPGALAGGSFNGVPEAARKALVEDLLAHKGTSLVVAGEHQSPEVHALAHAMNVALGNVGSTVMYTDPIEVEPVDQVASLKSLVSDLEKGAVQTLILLGGNPVYNAPADVNFREAMQKAKLRIALCYFDDETSSLCQWQVPEAYYLEAWGDGRAFDGTITIQQPLVQPLFRGKTPIDLLTFFGASPEQPAYEVVRAYWQSQKGPEFEAWWRKSVHDGVVGSSALQGKPVTLKAGWTSGLKPTLADGIEINFRPDPTIYDGRFANNGWLQELPKPLTKTTWENLALVGYTSAQKLDLQEGDILELRFQGRSVKAPAWILPGHANESITVHLGYGRTRAGRVGDGLGFNAYVLRDSASLWRGAGVEIRKTGDSKKLACTQGHWKMEGRNTVRAGTVQEYEKNPGFVKAMAHEFPAEVSMYPDRNGEGYAWGMAVDLSACNGCNACLVACQAENNISVVGHEQVLKQREMHWIRIDRYFEGTDVDNPQIHSQPVLCQQCENAPCEVVCPVAATVHSTEGLNDMVYNRCVGTRYCSNNCPYKVRRFNFLLFADFVTEISKMQKNPDVSVRSRGVMEKCTYCVQRINQARIASKREDREIKDGEVMTACQQTCPTGAIHFGNINDPNSNVARLKKEQLNYSLLGELNTRPRTTYLASLRNPNPVLEPAGAHESKSHG